MSIIFEKEEVWGFDHAIRGMRNPLDSWDKSDSGVFGSSVGNKNYIIGTNDMKLCQSLIAGGPEHSKFLRQIMVSVDITAPLYWWKEFDTYKVGTVANSCSTMHTIHKKEFTLKDFSCEHLGYFDPELPDDEQPYQDMTVVSIGASDIDSDIGMYPIDILIDVIASLNKCRELYLQTKDKKYWWQLIQLLPSSYNQKRTVTMNYANLRSMYCQRNYHKLDEWREGFVSWVLKLPYASDLISFVPFYV